MENNFEKNVFSHLLKDNKIFIPDWVKRVKIDVGTSLNAPFSEFWTNDNNDTCVFAFEPNPFNVEDLKNSKSGNLNKLNPSKIGNSVFLTECALSNFISENFNFFCAEGDGGTSSLYKPTDKGILIKDVINVPVLTLESFFNLFPWDRIPFIEQLKIDAQGSDLNILKGCGKFLEEKIAFIDIETTSEGYYEIDENPNEIVTILENLGFKCLKWGIDATFFNTKFENFQNEINYKTLH
jgi:FkbM family methyltransferase